MGLHWHKPDWYQEHEQHREDHLHVRDGAEAKDTKHQQLSHLDEGERVNLALRNTPDVVAGWVGCLHRAKTGTVHNVLSFEHQDYLRLYIIISFFLRSSIGGGSVCDRFNSSGTRAATFRLRGYIIIKIIKTILIRRTDPITNKKQFKAHNYKQQRKQQCTYTKLHI